MSDPGGSQDRDGANQRKQENTQIKSQGDQNHRVSQGKVRVIKCRFCSKEIKHQNYETHLKYQHPGKNFKDLRTKSDNSIDTMFKSKRILNIDSASEQSAEQQVSKKVRLAGVNIDYNGNTVSANQITKPLEISSEHDEINLLNSSLSTPVGSSEPTLKLPSATSLTTGSTSEEASQIEEDIDRENNGAEVFDISNLLAKLAPLAKLDEAAVARLASNIEELAKLKLEPEVTQIPTKDSSNLDSGALLMSCNSIEDITNRFQEYEYDEQLGAMICCVCSVENCSSKAMFDYKKNQRSNIPCDNCIHS